MNQTGNSASKHDGPTIMTRLKEETKSYHARMEAMPYFQTLIEHRLPLESYVNQLKALSIIHGVLESEVASSQDPRVAGVWDDDLRKLPWLEEDLSFFAPRGIPDAPPAVNAALEMVKNIRLRGVDDPPTMLGYLYVLEGSTLGNAMHRPDIAATYQLKESQGCRYYLNYEKKVKSHWNRFTEKMNSRLSDPALHDPVLEAALETFAGLEKLYTALFPLEKTEKSIHVTRINPEAGDHAIPDDEREIRAALKASDLTWAEYGYYEQRYGARGKRFSDSDICWLVTLTELDRETMQNQIEWICRLLATRGMPTIMMESSLQYLYEELKTAAPENEKRYAKLLGASEGLRKARESRINNEKFEALANEFDQATKAETGDDWKRTGKLLVNAVTDEASGTRGAVAAIQSWLVREDRFSSDWIRAVNETIGKAREELS